MKRALGSVRVTEALRLTAAYSKACEGVQFPAPAAQSLRIVALALCQGFESLEPVKVWSIVIGSAVGLLLTLLPRWFSRQAKWMPSASGIGLSWTFHW